MVIVFVESPKALDLIGIEVQLFNDYNSVLWLTSELEFSYPCIIVAENVWKLIIVKFHDLQVSK